MSWFSFARGLILLEPDKTMKYMTFRERPSGGWLKWAAAALIIAFVGAVLFYFLYMSPRRVTPILMYHSIKDKEGDSLSVAPSNFSRQMEYLYRQGYSVITLDELLGEVAKGRRYLPKTVVITFDDGYEDNYIHAFPVLSKYGMSATIFLVTDYIGKKDGYLEWDQVVLMEKNGVEPGGHTRSNVYLPSIKDSQVLFDEVSGCREDIEKYAGIEAGFFCYPTGGFNEKVKKAVKLAGYKGACTTNRGYDRLNEDVYELNRIKVTDSDMNEPFHFRAKLSGFYNVFRSAKSGD